MRFHHFRPTNLKVQPIDRDHEFTVMLVIIKRLSNKLRLFHCKIDEMLVAARI